MHIPKKHAETCGSFSCETKVPTPLSLEENKMSAPNL